MNDWIRKLLGEIRQVLSLPCHEATRLVSRALDERLPFRQRLALGLHLFICLWCRRYRNHLLLLRRAWRHLADRMPPAADASSATLSAPARQRIRAALRKAGSSAP